MFAVIKSGGKQYRVAKDDIITVEKLLGEAGDTIALDTVLLLGDEGKAATIGIPTIKKAQVFAEVVEQTRSEKILVFKKQRRKKYRRKKGHRQAQTVLRILEVSPTGNRSKATTKKASPKKDVPTGAKPETKKQPTIEAVPAKKMNPPAKKATTKKETISGAKPDAKKKAPAKKATPEKARKNKE